jgi:archaeal flagellar protein FlaG
MSSETITTALFLITAVIAASVLIAAIFPVIFQMAGTFTSASHASDQQIRTDFKIVLAVANDTQYARVWMKNTGSEKIAVADIEKSDVICGDAGNFNRLSLSPSGTLDNGQWTYTLSELNADGGNNFWDPGETVEIVAKTSTIKTTDGSPVYFQFILPNGIWRSDQFTVSATP